MTSYNDKLAGVAKFLGLIESEADLTKLLTEILTPSEVEKIHERIKIIACLSEGLSQRETAQRSEAAIATVIRGAHLLRDSKLVSVKLIALAKNKFWWQKFFFNSVK